MRTPILALFALATAVLQAQEKVTYYNNVNSELCFELYRTNDALGAFRVYVVIDGETNSLSDSVHFNTWHTLSRSRRSDIAQRWAIKGRRIEAERALYITRPAHFPKLRRPQLLPVRSRSSEQDAGDADRSEQLMP